MSADKPCATDSPKRDLVATDSPSKSIHLARQRVAIVPTPTGTPWLNHST